MYSQQINMSESSSDNQSLDLSGLDFGPAWARKGAKSTETAKEYTNHKGERPQRPEGGRKPRQGGRPPSGGGGGRDFKSTPNHNPKFKQNDSRERKPRRVFVAAEVGVSASIMPIEEGVDNLVKEIIASGRTYSVFDLARVVLGGRDRFHIVLKSDEKEKGPELLQSKHDSAVFLTKDECLTHAASATWLSEIYKTEEVVVEAPAGNFSNIAKCGFSGALLGPTNFHGYQDRVLELQRSKFSHLSLDDYKRRIVTESGDDVVNLWKESMTKRTIFKLVSDETVVFDSKSAMLQHFSTTEFETNFHKTRKAQVPSEIEVKKLSPSLLSNLKECIQEQRRYPGDLSSFLCRQLSGRQLAVFKWQGKLHSGPSRPHMLPEDLNMADRPKAIYTWVNENIGAGIDALWKSVCPVGIEEKVKFEWYHDLHWLINEGYVIFMNNGLLFPSSASKKPVAKQAKKKQAKKKTSPENKKPTEKKEQPKKKAEPAKKETKIEEDAKVETVPESEVKASANKPAEKSEEASSAKSAE
ncbi:MAG: hypothetical protein ACJAR1_001766 [Rubritalea sp.]|jgi:hypothetical protein